MTINLELWYSALGSPFGIILQTSDPERTKARLYALRAETADPDLASLSIVQSPTAPATDLWIVKKGPKANAS